MACTSEALVYSAAAAHQNVSKMIRSLGGNAVYSISVSSYKLTGGKGRGKGNDIKDKANAKGKGWKDNGKDKGKEKSNVIHVPLNKKKHEHKKRSIEYTTCKAFRGLCFQEI